MSIATVDAAASAVTYNLFRSEGNRASYIGPSHSDLVKQQIIVTSVSPKQVSDSYGNRRSTLNCVQTVTVANPAGDNVKRDMKLEMNASIPVGATFAEFQELMAHIADIAANDTIMESIFLTGKIEL
nr:MAG: hypothetical protein 2 [Leviviridae sp.]